MTELIILIHITHTYLKISLNPKQSPPNKIPSHLQHTWYMEGNPNLVQILLSQSRRGQRGCSRMSLHWPCAERAIWLCKWGLRSGPWRHFLGRKRASTAGEQVFLPRPQWPSSHYCSQYMVSQGVVLSHRHIIKWAWSHPCWAPAQPGPSQGPALHMSAQWQGCKSHILQACIGVKCDT